MTTAIGGVEALQGNDRRTFDPAASASNSE